MKVENSVVIVANLGEFKAYDVKKSEGIVGNALKESYSLKLIKEMDYLSAHQKAGEAFSDQAGSFQGANGEEHNRQTEYKKRSLKEIAQDIEDVILESKAKQLFLAFPKESSAQLAALLSPTVTAVLTKTVTSDLVKTDKNKILSYFE